MAQVEDARVRRPEGGVSVNPSRAGAAFPLKAEVGHSDGNRTAQAFLHLELQVRIVVLPDVLVNVSVPFDWVEGLGKCSFADLFRTRCKFVYGDDA